jgi:hypothetical protein
MKKNNLKHFVAVLAIFGFSYSVCAQETNEHSPKFMYEVGVGKGTLVGFQNISPWGVHYRGNYDSGMYLTLQFNYITKNRSFYGLKYDVFTTVGNYEIANSQRIAENINVVYLAPQIGWIRSVSPRLSIISNYGLGYSLYDNNGLLDNTEYRMISHMLGANLDFSMDYHFTKNLTMGCKTSLFAAYSWKLNRDIDGVKDKVTFDKWDRINPARFDFSVFLRRYF